MPNRGGFSWKRYTGISAAKSRISRRTGIPFTRSGRQRKIGATLTGGGCLIPITALILLLATIACGSTGSVTPTRTQPPPTVVPSNTPKSNTGAPTATPIAVGELPAATNPAATTPAPAPSTSSGPTAAKNANLRAGPGTTFAVVGGVKAGDTLQIVGKNPAGDWYALASGGWIAAFLVTDPPTVPVAANVPTAPTTAPAAVAPAARSGTIGSAAFTCVGGCAVAPDPSCAIKGNVNSEGVRIYHIPGGQSYNRTDIKPEEGDRWFCTADEARAAGFRPSER